MIGPRRTTAIVASVAGLVLLLGACASKTNTGATNPTTSETSGAGGVTVKTATVGIIGTALVTNDGRTLYMLTAEQAGKLACTSSACEMHWPPLLEPSGGSATAGGGVDATKLGTIHRPGGQIQVTYNGWPLYEFSGDSGAGQANGQGIQSFGGTWHPVGPNGQPIVGGPSTAPSSSSTNYGY